MKEVGLLETSVLRRLTGIVTVMPYTHLHYMPQCEASPVGFANCYKVKCANLQKKKVVFKHRLYMAINSCLRTQRLINLEIPVLVQSLKSGNVELG